MDRLKVLTLNIWNRLGPWEKRLAIIRRGLEELSPDVVGLQEVLSMPGFMSQVNAIAEDLGFQTVSAGDWELGAGLTLGNAILSKYPIAESKSFPLPTGDREPRSLQFATLNTPLGRIPFFNTHLTHRFEDGEVRMAQVKTIVERIENAAAAAEFPAVLVGDFNAAPDTNEVKTLKEKLCLIDCWQFSEAEGTVPAPGYTFSRENSFALHSDEASRRIDYIFVATASPLRALPTRVVLAFENPEGDIFASDHFGVYAELKLAPIPAPP